MQQFTGEPIPQPGGSLQPPRRRPPTAIGAATEPPPDDERRRGDAYGLSPRQQRALTALARRIARLAHLAQQYQESGRAKMAALYERKIARAQYDMQRVTLGLGRMRH